MTEEDMSMTGAIIVVSTFVAWMLVGDALSRRSRNVERALEGEAVIEHLMRRLRPRLFSERNHVRQSSLPG